MKKSTIITILIPIIMILCISLSLFFQYQKNKGLAMPEGTIGNTAGNIRGQGLFCEYEDKVYFANPYDDGALYVMNPDGSQMKKLLTSSASYINAGANHIYYYMESSKGGTGLGYVRSISGLYRCDLKGNDITCLNDDLLTMALLTTKGLVYQHYDNKNFSSVHRITSDNKKQDMVLFDGIIETAETDGYNLYYANTTPDHYLHRMSIETGADEVIWQGNLSFPTVIGPNVYYMDIDRDYCLARYHMNENKIQILTNERLDFYNIYGNVIFYQTNGKNPGLWRMNIDGSDPVLIAEGVYNRINCTSAFTYFYEYGNDNAIYRTPTFSAPYVDNFPEALDAALKAK